MFKVDCEAIVPTYINHSRPLIPTLSNFCLKNSLLRNKNGNNDNLKRHLMFHFSFVKNVLIYYLLTCDGSCCIHIFDSNHWVRIKNMKKLSSVPLINFNIFCT